MLKVCIKHPVTVLSLFSLMLSACAVTDTSQPDVPNNIKSAYTSAIQAMKAGQHRQALSQFKRISKIQPGLAGPQTNMGILYLKLNKLEQALQALQKAIELNPTNTIAYNYLGIVYRNQGQFDAAEQAYLKALEIDNKYDYAHLNLGILYDLYKSDDQTALKHYRHYLELTGQPDKTVEKWIVDIQRRSTAQNQGKESEG